MSFTLADLERLDRAIASGTLEVEYGDSRVKYQSTAALLRARTTIAAALGLTMEEEVYRCTSRGV